MTTPNKTEHKCPTCNADLTEKHSITRTYSNGDVEQDVSCEGHYDAIEGHFEPDTNVCLGSGYQYGDDSDTCIVCDSVV
ncbi:hypothetical protein VCHA53O466_140150 [Vibrio chagasii]|nr:hypothetical protein VCHA53O466_140150 [Vibrio chagasii]